MAGKLLRGLLLGLLRSIFEAIVYRGSQPAHFEVERKFQLEESEVNEVIDTLRAQGFSPAGVVIMTDTFLPPPSKGDMFRVRDETIGSATHTVFTRKTWVKTADGGRERREAELEVSQMLRTIILLCGRLLCGELASFVKERRLYENLVDGLDVVVCVDEVKGLGSYSGSYLEVEVMVPPGGDTATARDVILQVATKLFGGERSDVGRSYQEMLSLHRQGK